MKIYAVILTWDGHARHAEQLEAAIAPAVDHCDVINSEEAAIAAHPNWVNIGRSGLGNGYGMQQCQTAAVLLDRSSANVLAIICADVSHDNWPAIFARARDVFVRYPITGIFAPNVDFTPWKFDRQKLPHIEGLLYHVPQTDGMCLFVRKELIAACPWDPVMNKFGWGIDFALIGLAAGRGLWVVRDYHFCVKHPRGTGYNTIEAQRQMSAWIGSFPDGLKAAITDVMQRSREQKVGRESRKPESTK